MTSPTDRRLVVVALVAAAFAGAPGCAEAADGPKISERSKIKVQLPPTPDLTPRAVQVKHQDGAYTVEGVLASVGSLLGQKVTVRGRVVEVVGCPQKPIEGDADVAPPPRTDCYPPPHMFLADAGDEGERRLLVAGPPRAGIAAMVKGRVVSLEGRIDMVSPDGAFIRQAGLLVLPAPAPGDASAGPDSAGR